MLKDIKATTNKTEERDSLGGGGYIWDSGIYPVTVKLAFLDTYPSGALNINVIFADENGKELTWKNCITNAQKEAFYKDKKTGEEKALPGMMIADSFTDIVTGKELLQLDESKAVVEVYDYDQEKYVPKEKDVLKELLGKRVVIGVIRELNDKNVKDNAGKWVPSGETREANDVDKFFFADGTTRPEKAEGKPAEFINTWKGRWEGEIKDNTDKSIKGKAAKQVAAPRKSLFPDE